jgi:hypothetical protein
VPVRVTQNPWQRPSLRAVFHYIDINGVKILGLISADFEA